MTEADGIENTKTATDDNESGLDDAQCQEVMQYLRANRGFDFSGYKTASLYRRLRKRMQMVNIATCADYLDYLEVHPDEFAELFNTILINVTTFFRDPEHWDTLKEILEQRLAAMRPTEPIRIWSAGCASGQEPYTIMMLLSEMIGIEAVRDRVKLYATDIDDEALAEARLATYSARAVNNLPEEMLAKYFRRVNGNFVFNSDLRRNVIFGKHDLITDAPISRIDLLTCRNTLMYFNAEAQARVLTRFHFAVNSSGILMLGKAEMLFSHSTLFLPINLKGRIFSKVANVVPKVQEFLALDEDALTGDGQVSFAPMRRNRNLQSMMDALPTAHIVVDSAGMISVVNLAARQMFHMSDGDLGRSLHDMEISYRPVDLRSMLDRAYAELTTIESKETPYAVTASKGVEYGIVDVQVAPVYNTSSQALGAVISFTDVTRFRKLKEELQETNRELETAYEELQSTNEELETTNEELQSTVEELETTNEELQSTNEELETMNEELQSSNEELHAINDELRLRSMELNKVNSFMTAIMSSLHAGVAVLDPDLHIQVWNQRAEDLWGVRSNEAVGQHLMALDIGLPLEQLRAPARQVASGEAEFQELTVTATNRRGKPVKCRVLLSQIDGPQNVPQGILVLMEV